MQSRHGRSAPRSRLGCVTCKQRRVRCDEAHPVCGHCRRLQLECRYQAPKAGQQRRRRAQTNTHEAGEDEDDPLGVPLPPTSGLLNIEQPLPADIDHLLLRRGGRQRSQQNGQQHNAARNQLALPDTAAPDLWAYSYTRSGHITPTGNGNINVNNSQPFTPARRYDFFDVFADLDTSWAGEYSCVVLYMQTPTALDTLAVAAESLPEPPLSTLAIASGTDISPALTIHPAPNTGGSNNDTSTDGDVEHLMKQFHQIVQPPAAILIGGFERWRRLQNYLCKLGDKSRAVRSALSCFIELLVIDDGDSDQQNREKRMQRILERHSTACQEIEAKLGNRTESDAAPLRPKTREHFLTAIFLLSWFKVVRDQDDNARLFPRHLAERVITSAYSTSSWSRYSQQLLSWLNTLDSKAAHMGRDTLLSPKSPEAVAHLSIHITSSLDESGVTKDNKKTTNDDDDSELSPVDDMSPSSTSTGVSHDKQLDRQEAKEAQAESQPRWPSLGPVEVKQILLRTVLQPALEWYLTSQSYCRRISAHDKHHRQRFTSEDEYEVILAGKQLEAELFELWDDRPTVMSLTANQLRAVVAADLAKRLETIFSVYLASFWILFVHFHRISRWHLPHSALARRALAEVWQHMQRAYGEEIPGPGSTMRKVIHPSLLWPVFLFGSECTDPAQAQWSVEQLEALGEAKPVLGGPTSNATSGDSDAIDDNNNTLPH